MLTNQKGIVKFRYNGRIRIVRLDSVKVKNGILKLTGWDFTVNTPNGGYGGYRSFVAPKIKLIEDTANIPLDSLLFV